MYYLPILQARSPGDSTSFSALGYTRLRSGCWLAGLWWEALGRIYLQPSSDCWQDPVPCGCRTEAPIPVVAVTRGHLYLPQAPPQFLHVDPCVSEPATGCRVILVPDFPSAAALTSAGGSAQLLGLMIRLEPPG